MIRFPHIFIFIYPTIKTNQKICWKVSLPYVKYLNISFFQVCKILLRGVFWAELNQFGCQIWSIVDFAVFTINDLTFLCQKIISNFDSGGWIVKQIFDSYWGGGLTRSGIWQTLLIVTVLLPPMVFLFFLIQYVLISFFWFGVWSGLTRSGIGKPPYRNSSPSLPPMEASIHTQWEHSSQKK